MMDGRSDERTVGRTDGRTDERTDERSDHAASIIGALVVVRMPVVQQVVKVSNFQPRKWTALEVQLTTRWTHLPLMPLSR